MTLIVLLDAGPLGMVSNPKASVKNRECFDWLQSLVESRTRIIVPEIADYEVRRELIRAQKLAGLARLDLIKRSLEYLPLTTAVMLKAAELWAEARNKGEPTADASSLDCDVVLSAQAISVGGMVASQNVGHLSRFVEAKAWNEIRTVSS
jgi:predicted nucleic acid-binding protein